MLEQVSPALMLRVKRWCYLFFLLPLLFPVASYFAAESWGYADFFAFGTVLFVFVLVPAIDQWLGHDPSNPDETLDVPRLASEQYYRWLTMGSVPAYFLLILWAGSIFTDGTFSLLGQVGWILSIGTVGALAITIAHEMIHKDEKSEQWLGGVLLSMVCYGGFKVEHLRGHHVNVSTPEDASSARFNQSLYEFLPHAYYHNFRNAWLLQKKNLERKNKSLWSYSNELIWWYGLSILQLVLFSVLWGWQGAIFFLGQSFIALTLLEIVNYLEHYGLHRRKLENGRYERVMPEHSWNSNYFLTNLFLFHLQRHSDHHANAKHRYQVLRHYDDAPQLPAGYPAMVLLALVPPLWRRVMNPKVEAYYQGEEFQLTNKQVLS